jgi:hypothetical protein
MKDTSVMLRCICGTNTGFLGGKRMPFNYKIIQVKEFIKVKPGGGIMLRRTGQCIGAAKSNFL